MAKRPAGKAKASLEDRVVEAVLTLAAARGWRDIALADIAEAADVPLVELYPAFPSKLHVLAAFERRIDRAVLSGTAPEDAGEPRRDRLFDVVMRRLDALAPNKEAVAALAADLPRDPPAALMMVPLFARSMAWMLTAAGFDVTGVGGALRVKVLGMVYLATLRVWLGDDEPDLAHTMAALDRNLDRFERLLPFGG